MPRESFRWYCGFNTSNNLCSYFLNVALLGERLEEAVGLTADKIPSHTALLHESESIHVCPYELARLAMAQSRVIVVPYQYAFDPASKPWSFTLATSNHRARSWWSTKPTTSGTT